MPFISYHLYIYLLIISLYLFYSGVSIYKTTELYELILEGLPDKYRCELWLVFSGAIHQKNTNPFLYKNLVNQSEDDFEVTMDEIERDLHR